MKKTISLLVLAMASSFSVAAEEPAQGWYVGLDGLSSEVTIKKANKEESYDLDTGVGFHVGYDKKFTHSFITGFELEFINYGAYTFGQSQAYSTNGTVVADVDMTFTSINLNIRPKYYIAGSGFYVGGLLGLGQVSVDLELTKSGYESASLDEETGSAFNYGVEAGYEFESGWMLNAGMRGVTTEINDIDTDIKATYVGARYKF